jgi:hypothetical protein
MSRTKVQPVLLTLFLITMIVGCSSNEKRADKNTDIYIHPASQVPFPHSIGEFVRTKVIEDSPDHAGPRVSYYLKKRKWEASISVFVYPAPESEDANAKQDKDEEKPNVLLERMNAIRQEMLDAGKDEEHRFVAVYDIAIVKGENPYAGKRAYFRHEVDVFSNAYLFKFGDWFIEYRSVFDRDLEWSEDQFVKDHPWITDTAANISE